MALLSCLHKQRAVSFYRLQQCASHRRHAISRSASVTSSSSSAPSSVIAKETEKETMLGINQVAQDQQQRQQKSWRTLFLTFLAILEKDSHESIVAHENADEIMNQSHISHVVQSNNNDLFWRYDMDSYAANSKNEDRSQYIFDIITTQSNETDPASMDPTDEKEIFFCACYDGHGGEEAVEFVQSRLYSNIKKHLVLKGPQSVRDAIFSGFTETDQQFNQQSLKKFEQGVWSACSVGACAVIALVVDKRLYIASCGDCRAIMAFRDSEGKVTVEQVTFDHSANEAKEQARLRGMHPDDYDVIREIGYKNFYVKGRLQPTRSIGDTYMKCKEVNRAPMPRGLRINGSFKKPYITAVPDIFEFDLDDRLPEFLVLGSDGLFGELSNEEVAEKVAFFRKQGVENVSQALRTEVLTRVAECYGFDRAEIESILPGERRNYHDDITIDIVHFAPPVA